MDSRRRLADEERLGDLAIRPPGSDSRNHLALAGGQAVYGGLVMAGRPCGDLAGVESRTRSRRPMASR